jgi:hypothetical protein
VVAEATWCIRDTGVCGWEKSPYYQAFGDNLISEVYVMAYKIAQEMGLTIGPNGDIEFFSVTAIGASGALWYNRANSHTGVEE